MLVKRRATWNIVFFRRLADVALKAKPVAHVASRFAKPQVLFIHSLRFEGFLHLIGPEEDTSPVTCLWFI